MQLQLTKLGQNVIQGVMADGYIEMSIGFEGVFHGKIGLNKPFVDEGGVIFTFDSPNEFKTILTEIRSFIGNEIAQINDSDTQKIQHYLVLMQRLQQTLENAIQEYSQLKNPN